MKNRLVWKFILLASLMAWFGRDGARGALPVGVSWEVRTTGSDTNGGGFVFGASGTDFSQQDAAQFSGTNLVSANGTTNPCAVTSATHNYVATDVGNLIQITAGTNWTTGFYQIVSVAANAATLDRACGSAAALSGGTWAEGGGLQNISTAFANYVSGNTVWIKSGTYTFTSGITLQNITNSGVTIQGYQTTHGDFTGTVPLITTATNSVNLFQGAGTSNGLAFINMNFSNTAGTRGDGFRATLAGAGGNSLSFYNCTFDGFTTSVRGDFNTDFYWSELTFTKCEIKNATGHGVWNDGSTYFQGCNLHNNTLAGFFTDSNGGDAQSADVFVDTVFHDNQDGIRYAFGSSRKIVVAQNNVFFNQTRDGIRADSGNTSILAQNNIFDTNAGVAIDITAANTSLIAFGLNNAFRNNGTNMVNFPNGTSAAFGNITLTVSPFTNAAGNNFSLNNTAGGGALVRAAGFPGTIPNAGTGALDVGALQHTAVASTGSNSAYAQ